MLISQTADKEKHILVFSFSVLADQALKGQCFQPSRKLTAATHSLCFRMFLQGACVTFIAKGRS